MKKNILHYISCVFILMIFVGCAATDPNFSQSSKDLPLDAAVLSSVEPIADEGKQLSNVGKEKIEQYVQEKGIVFGKTNFQGLLKTVYVKIQIESLAQPVQVYQLLVAGEDKDDKNFPWDVKAVNPGYFFIELPVGEYRLANVTIPVGTTVASEPMNIRFKVYPHSVVYIGTLKVDGTKEKIRLGGVPIIKPGFEYRAEILDERDEAVYSITQNYPDLPQKLKFDLMEILLMSPEELK